MMDTNRTPDPEAVQRILEERARALAEPSRTDTHLESEGLVVLMLGGERYGLDMAYIREIRPLSGLTPIPGVPPFWAGLVNLRGRLYPVLDLHRYFSLTQNNPVEESKVVLVSGAGLDVCLLVDDVLGTRTVPFSEVGTPLTDASSAQRDVVVGVTSDLLSVLDLEALLSDPALVVQDEVV